VGDLLIGQQTFSDEWGSSILGSCRSVRCGVYR